MNYKYQARDTIQKELEPGEKLLWAGIPKQGIIFRRSDVFMIPFSLLWGGFAIFWETMALGFYNEKSGAAGIVFPLFGIPFVLIGLYMIFGRFIHDSKKRAKTFYGLTNQRAIVVSGIFKKNVKSLDLKNLGDVSLLEKSDKSGTITFGQENKIVSFFGRDSFPGMAGSVMPKFELTENVKDVYNQLREQTRADTGK